MYNKIVMAICPKIYFSCASNRVSAAGAILLQVYWNKAPFKKKKTLKNASSDFQAMNKVLFSN